MPDFNNQKILEAAAKLKPLLSKVRTPEKKAADDRLFTRFRPIFRPENIQNLTEADFRSFTMFSENEHWTSIHRHNGKILEDMPKLKSVMRVLTDETKPIESRIDEFRPKGVKKTVSGLGSSIYSAILFVLYPDKYPVYNSKTKRTLKDLGLYSEKNSESYGTRYKKVMEISKQLAQATGCSLIELDSLYHEFLAISPSFFKLSPGKSGDAWQEQKSKKLAAIGWNSSGNLDDYDDMTVAAQTAIDAGDGSGVGYISSQFTLIHDEIEEGDYVLYYAKGKIVGIGKVCGEYQFDEKTDLGHSRPVTFLEPFRPVDITTDEEMKSFFYENNTLKAVEKKSLLRTILAAIEDQNPGFKENIKISSGDQVQELDVKFSLETSFTGFKREAFDLLKQYKENPTKATYQKTKEEFETLLKNPTRNLMASVAPCVESVLGDEIETETWITSVIQKNDYGKGGIHSHYWAAFYPTGKKRTASPQLYVILYTDQLRVGFGFGLYSKEHEVKLRDQFSNELFWNDEYREKIKNLGVGLRIWDRKEDKDTYGGEIDQDVLFKAFNSKTATPNFDVAFSPEEVERLGSRLSDKVNDIFTALMPLYIMATSDRPEYYLDKWNSTSNQIEDDEIVAPESSKYDWASFLEDLNISDDNQQAQFIRSVLGSRNEKQIYENKQIIFFGPPGTGKTRSAVKLAEHLATSKKTHIKSVQFHQSYGYEQFIEGIKPKAVNGQLTYDYEDGVFVKFCRLAEKRPHEQFVFVIDEINRGNISRIFGELMYLLEYRDQKLPLLYSQNPFAIPKNVAIIGTMNSADRSIALVDYALRRRFQFIEVRPQTSVLRSLYSGVTNQEHETAIVFLDKLNAKIRDPRLFIGHSYFISEECKYGLTKTFVKKVWDTALFPLLQEYFLSTPNSLKEFDFSGIWNEALAEDNINELNKAS